MIEPANEKKQISNSEISIKAWVATILTIPSMWFTGLILAFWADSINRSSVMPNLVALGLTLLIPSAVAYCIFRSYREKSSTWVYLGMMATIYVPILIFLALYIIYYIIEFINKIPILIYTYF